MFDEEMVKLLTTMFAISGDFISQIYSGTRSVLTQMILKGKEDFL